MAGPGSTEIQILNSSPETVIQNDKEQEIRDYVGRALRVTKERFFDTGQAATRALDNPQYTPGYVSLVAVTNSEQNMDVVVSVYDSLRANGGVVGEEIAEQEIQISYRQLKGSRVIPKPVRSRIYGYECGVIVLPSESRTRPKRPDSVKSTMRSYDVKRWEEGDTALPVSIGVYPGQRRLQPTKADYEAILTTVTRGTKNEVLTRNSIQNLTRINRGYKWKEKSLTDAQADIASRNEEIMQGEAVAVQSAEDARLLLEARATESDHASEQSFSIGEQRLRELARQFSGQDAEVINYAAGQLANMGASINMVRTLLESNDPRVKEALKNLTRDKTEVSLTPSEMYSLTEYIAANWEFAEMKENAGFRDEVIYGVMLGDMHVPSPSKKGAMDRISASQGAKMRILEALEFLRPGETLAQRMDRIGGVPAYQRSESGEKTGIVHTFRENPNNGESIIWDPYYKSEGESANIRVTSPLFGSFFIAMINMDMQITSNSGRDKLEPTTGLIDYITCRFEGGGRDTYPDDIGGAMLRLSKKFPSDKIPQSLIG